MIIYKIVNDINAKIYGGQTIQTSDQRWSDHKQMAKSGAKYPLYRAMRKHGISHFKLIPIDIASSREELDKKEIDYIALHNLTNPKNGYNIRPGGKTQKNDVIVSKPVYCYETETIYPSAAEASRQLKLRCNKVSAVANGTNSYVKGYTFAYLNKDGSIPSPKSKWVPNALNKKMVYCPQLNEVFASTYEAAQKLGLERKSISNAANGLSVHANFLTFQFTNSKEALKLLEQGKNNPISKMPHSHNKEILCHQNGQIYPSVKEAAKQLNIARAGISAVLVGRSKQTKGYTFTYAQPKAPNET